MLRRNTLTVWKASGETQRCEITEWPAEGPRLIRGAA